MTGSPDETKPLPAAERKDRALVALSRPARWIVAGVCLVMAELRILWDAPIDALSVGLIGAAFLLVFARIKEIGWGGVTASFVEREIAQLEGKVESVEVRAETVKPSPPPKPVLGPVVVEPGTGELVAEGHAPEVHVQAADQVVLRETARATLIPLPPTNPTERVLWAVEQIRIELIILAGNSGNLPQRIEWVKYRSEALAAHLATRQVIPEELARITRVVGDARNALVHGGLAREALSRVDTVALELLQKLRAVKRQYVRVRDPDPTLFVDDDLIIPYEATDGVMLVTLDEQGNTLHLSVFPRSTEYEKDRFVSWEWDLKRGFDEEALYRHPVTNEPKTAWSEAATFVGRQYPEEWGIEYRLPPPDAGLA